jgi:hypothetical protein
VADILTALRCARHRRNSGRGFFFLAVMDVLSALLPWVVWIHGFLFSLYCETGTEDENRTFSLCSGLPRAYFPIFLSLVIPDGAIPVWVQLSLYLVCIACFVYLFHFVAKNLVMVKIKKALAAQQILPSIFASVFFPLGVWIIQPEVNRLYAESKPRRGTI